MRRARTTAPRWAFLAALLVPAAASAQQRAAGDGVADARRDGERAGARGGEGAGAGEGEGDDDALHPRRGRVRVVVEHTRAGPIPVGLADAPPARAEPGVRFDASEHRRVCRTPCTMYLAPGTHRLFGDAATDFAWRADVTVPPSGARVRLRGQLLGWSAASGVLLTLGFAGVLGGPAIAVATALVGESRALQPALIGGGIALAVGAVALWGAWRLRDVAAPRVESVSALASGRAGRARWGVAPAVVPGGGGGMVVAAFGAF